MEVNVPHVYKYKHPKTKKWYIGSHDGHNPNYDGSGVVWQHAKKKYGIKFFNKEILYEGPMFRQVEEIILTCLDAANCPDSYNLKNEAWGGSFPGKLNGMYGKKLSPEERYKCGNAFRGIKRPDHSKRMKGEGNPMYGKNEQAYGIINRAKENSGKTYEEIFGVEKAKIIKETMSKNRKGKPHNLIEKICPHCGLKGRGSNMTRYHFDKCKALK